MIKIDSFDSTKNPTREVDFCSYKSTLSMKAFMDQKVVLGFGLSHWDRDIEKWF